MTIDGVVAVGDIDEGYFLLTFSCSVSGGADWTGSGLLSKLESSGIVARRGTK